jgi:hypothetical protein
VRGHVRRSHTGATEDDYRAAWDALYRAFKTGYGVDLKRRAEASHDANEAKVFGTFRMGRV